MEGEKMNILAAFTVRQINEGKAIDLEQLDWQVITDNWRCGTLVDIIYELNKVEDVERVRDCILSLVRKSQIKPSEVFVNEFVSRCNFHIAVMKQSTAMAGRTDQPPAEPTTGTDTDQQQAFEVPEYLTETKAEKMLLALEGTLGYRNRKVLDRTQTPWAVSSMPDWGKVAQIMQEKLSVEMYWDDWGKLIGKTGKALQKAYYKSRGTDSQTRIFEVLNKLK
jgi:hypothetical protein